MKLNNDQRDLRTRYRQLVDAKLERRIDLTGLEALAECSFRLALHPETANDERVTLLALAHMHSATNPKYSYHLGLLYLKQGRLARAALWFETAIRRSPNSHRIWVHISLLQKQLNTQYSGDPEYEKNSLREISSGIASHVREGADRFPAELIRFKPHRSAAKQGGAAAKPRANEPGVAAPLSYARRLIDEGLCRWPSVYELELEDALEAECTRRSLERVVPLMEHIVRSAAGRSGGTSSFAIAVAQWLAAGYPTEGIRRWRETLQLGDYEPASVLVGRLLELYEAPLHELPQLLQKALSVRAIPLQSATLIHYQRLILPLFPPFTEHAAFRLARTALVDHEPGVDEEQTAQLAEARRRLAGGLSALRANGTLKGDTSTVRSWGPEYGRWTEDSWTHLHSDAVLLADAFVEVSSYSQELMALAQEAELPEAGRERLIFEGRALVAIQKRMQRIAGTLGQDCDAYLASLDVDSSVNEIQAGEDTRSVLNDVCYSSLRYLEDEVEQHASAAGAMTSSDIPLPAAIQALEKKLDVLERGQDDGEQAAGQAAIEFFLQAEKSVPALLELRQSLFDHLMLTHVDVKKLAEDDSQDGAKETRRAITLKAAVEHCKNGTVDILDRLNAATEKIAKLPPSTVESRIGADYPMRRQKSREQLAKLAAVGRLRGLTRKIEFGLAKRPEPADVATGQEGDEADELASKMADLFSALGFREPVQREPQPDDSQAPDSESAPEDLAAVAADDSAVLESAPGHTKAFKESTDRPEDASFPTLLADILDELSGAYTACRDSLHECLGEQQSEADYRALLAVIDSREAEMMHALGLRNMAGRIWGRMSRSQPSHIGLLRNVAVCGSFDPDRGLGLNAWRRYLEALYYYDAVLGKPNLLAPERITFHESIGMALLPQSLQRFLYESAGDVKPDESSRVMLIEQHEQMRQHVLHIALMFLNAKVDFRSPLLFLGVDRGESQEVRTEAAGKLKGMCDKLTAEFGWPVFDLYAERVRGHIEDQLEICRDPANITHRRDPNFQTERPRQLEWLREACHFKLRLRNLMLMGDREYVGVVSWPAMIRFVDAMITLDDIPVDLSPSFLGDLALELHTPPAQLTSVARNLGAILIHLKYQSAPLNDPTNLSEEDYRRMLAAWTESGLVGLEVSGQDLFDYQKLEALLDAPRALYHDEAQKIASSSTGYSVVIEFLTSWAEKYPGITGPQRTAAQLHVKNKDNESAYALLESCLDTARFESGRRECLQLMNSLQVRAQVESEDYEQVLPTLKERVEEDQEGKVELLTQYLQAFARHALDSAGNPGHVEMMEGVDAWLDRFRGEMDDEGVSEVLRRRDQTLIVAFTAHLGDISQRNVDPRSESEALTTLIDAYPTITEPRVWRMRASFRIAEAEQERGREAPGRTALERVRQDAVYVRDHAADERSREVAKDVLEEVEEFYS